MFRRLLPKETCFFDFFEEHIVLCIRACEELVAMEDPTIDIGAKVASIKELEREADTVTHRCIAELQKSFITPFDRGEIHDLIKNLDDILDDLDEAVSRIIIFELKELRPETTASGHILLRATTALSDALKLLRNLKNSEAIHEKCIAVHQCEHDGDTLMRSALMRLFREEKEAVVIIKWKEIFDYLERATDRCSDVADAIEGVVIEAS